MKKVILNKIKIDSWRGQSHDIEFGINTILKGANKVGKSTIKDAFLWVLTGYDSNNRLNFNLFDNNYEYTAQDNPVASVEIILNIDDNNYSFKRTAQKGFVRRRGSDTYQLKGTDNYSFFLDSIELGAGEYKTRVSSLLCDYDILRIILDTKLFLDMDWKEQRLYLSKMVPEFKESDFGGAYKDLFKELRKYSMEELKAKIQTISSPIKSQLKSLPLAIQTLEENLPDITMAESAVSEISLLKQRINEIDLELSGSYDRIKEIVEKRNSDMRAISLMRNELDQNEMVYEDAFLKKIRGIEQDIKDIEKKNRDISWKNEKSIKQKESLLKEIEMLERRIPMFDAKREELINKKDEIKSLEFQEEVCSLCKQPLPKEQLEKAKEKFMDNKQKQLNEIVSQGKQNNENKKIAIERIDNLRSSLSQLPEPEDLLSAKELEKEIEEETKKYIPFKETEEYIKRIANIELKKSQLTEVPDLDNEDLLFEKSRLISLIQSKSECVGLIEERNKQVRKIENLKKEMEHSAIVLAEQEKLYAEIKDYEEECAKKIAESVGKHFLRCHITMASQDKSGNWVPDCIIKSPDGAISSTCNGAEKILLGVDISNAFSNFFNICVPLFIDDVNLISDYSEIYTVGQQILLQVSDNTSLVKL